MQGTNGVMQVKLTNVAVVRLKRNGIRFEVAAYKNKVVNWRSRVETDINEVLQVPSVFTNVSRGIHAKASDLAEAFGTDDSLKCAMMILDKGEFEVGELERQLQYDTLFRDIATTVAEKCVNPTSRRPYPLAFIEKALRDVHFSVIPTKTAKQQALKAITSLKAIIPIERSKMHLRLMVGDGEVKEVRGWLEGLDAECIVGESAILGGEDGAVHSLDLEVDPGLFRVIEEGAFAGAVPGRERRGAPLASFPPPLWVR
jgi:ribosome maturation protein SDO1